MDFLELFSVVGEPPGNPEHLEAELVLGHLCESKRDVVAADLYQLLDVGNFGKVFRMPATDLCPWVVLLEELYTLHRLEVGGEARPLPRLEVAGDCLLNHLHVLIFFVVGSS